MRLHRITRKLFFRGSTTTFLLTYAYYRWKLFRTNPYDSNLDLATLAQRASQSLPQPTLAGWKAELKRCKRTRFLFATYSRYNLQAANLTGGEFLKDTFQECLLQGVDLSQSKLTSVRVERSNCRNINFSKSNFSNTVFEECDLANSNFEGATIGDGVVFLNCNLSHANFSKCQFGPGAITFANCNLFSANFTHAQTNDSWLHPGWQLQRQELQNESKIESRKVTPSSKTSRVVEPPRDRVTTFLFTPCCVYGMNVTGWYLPWTTLSLTNAYHLLYLRVQGLHLYGSSDFVRTWGLSDAPSLQEIYREIPHPVRIRGYSGRQAENYGKYLADVGRTYA